jgi:hypothetical protein
MKKGPLSNEEKSFIRNGAKDFSSIEELATKMDRSVLIVTKFLSTVAEETAQDISSLFARKEERGVTVMTEAASIAGDENKKKKNVQSPPRYKGYIHKIKE